ncbi:hypothetical protein CCACVL1_01230, partial [Corchorus capsularis]
IVLLRHLRAARKNSPVEAPP